MKPTPYVGITGFMSRYEIDECLCQWIKACELNENNDSRRKLMVGILSSSTTITGQTNSLSSKFPKREFYRDIFLKSDDIFNCFHFATSVPEKLYDHLMLMLEYGAGLADGIQLNIVWPEPKTLQRVKAQYSRLKFVLQVSPHLLGYSPMTMTTGQIAQAIKYSYGDLIDYVLVDFSRGLGKPMPVYEVRKYLTAIAEANPNIGLVEAGGLQAENLRKIMAPMLNEFPGISFDAERCLRDDLANGGNLDLTKTAAYLKEAAQII